MLNIKGNVLPSGMRRWMLFGVKEALSKMDKIVLPVALWWEEENGAYSVAVMCYSLLAGNE